MIYNQATGYRDKEPTVEKSPSPQTQETENIESKTEEAPELLEDELLVEEISIDGMCGVY